MARELVNPHTGKTVTAHDDAVADVLEAAGFRPASSSRVDAKPETVKRKPGRPKKAD